MPNIQQQCSPNIIEMAEKPTVNKKEDTIESLTMAINEINPPPPSYQSIEQQNIRYVAPVTPVRLVNFIYRKK